MCKQIFRNNMVHRAVNHFYKHFPVIKTFLVLQCLKQGSEAKLLGDMHEIVPKVQNLLAYFQEFPTANLSFTDQAKMK